MILFGWMFVFAAAMPDAMPVSLATQCATKWRDGCGRLGLTQKEDRAGVDALHDRRIKATARGRTLREVSTQDGRSGDFELVQSHDGRIFACRFDSTE